MLQYMVPADDRRNMNSYRGVESTPLYILLTIYSTHVVCHHVVRAIEIALQTT